MTTHCLLIIDMLHDFLDRWEAGRRSQLIANTNQLVTAFRASDLPIIWVRQEFKADLSDAYLEMRDKGIANTIEGTKGAQVHGDLAYRPGDTTIVKKRYSAFFGTNLDEVLSTFGAPRLVIAGLNTHACIRMAAIDAYQRDLRVTLAVECIGSYDADHARRSVQYMDGKIATVMMNTQIIGALDQASA